MTQEISMQNPASKVTPFKIDVPQSALDDLHKRLKQTRWTDEPKDAGWKYGTNPAYLRELVDYWQNHYDWRKHEAQLNAFPQYETEIDGVTIHFIHVRGKGPKAKPLILTHGWPDSFYRFYKVIPMLADAEKYGGKEEDSFDVIVPSLPGFGFSDRVALSAERTANLWAKLMTEVLGYKTFVAAGGDLGTALPNTWRSSIPMWSLRSTSPMSGTRPERKTGPKCLRQSKRMGKPFNSGCLPKAPTLRFNLASPKRSAMV